MSSEETSVGNKRRRIDEENDKEVEEIEKDDFELEERWRRSCDLQEAKWRRWDELVEDEKGYMVIKGVEQIDNVKNDEELLKLWRKKKKLKKKSKYSYERFYYPSEKQLRRCEKGVLIKHEFQRVTYDNQILATPFLERSLADWQDLRYSQRLKKNEAWENGEEVSSDGFEGWDLDVLKKGKRYKRRPFERENY
jgi:hypothetical protein